MGRKLVTIGAVALAAVFLCMGCELLSGIDEPSSNGDTPSLTTVTIAAIEGVTPPIAGSVPVTEITATDQYTGIVRWNNNNNYSFEISTVYTATITLWPEPGYTLDGVLANFFTVAGADSCTNNAGSGVVTAVFPQTSFYPEITITRHPENATVTAGSVTGSLSVQASVTEGVPLEYQWYSSTSNDYTDVEAISGQTNASFTIPTNLTIGTYYYYCMVLVKDTGGATTEGSNMAMVIVASHLDITFTKQPESLTVTAGMITEYLSVTAEVTPDTALSYQWYSNTSGSNTGGTKIDGETSTSFILPSGLTEGEYYYYFCEVSAAGSPVPVRSDAATVAVGVSTEIVMQLTAITEADVIAQTVSASANTDTPFTVSGTDYTAYQWYLNGAPVGMSAAYTFNQTAEVYELAVVVTNSAGQKYSGSCRVTVR